MGQPRLDARGRERAGHARPAGTARRRGRDGHRLPAGVRRGQPPRTTRACRRARSPPRRPAAAACGRCPARVHAARHVRPRAGGPRRAAGADDRRGPQHLLRRPVAAVRRRRHRRAGSSSCGARRGRTPPRRSSPPPLGATDGPEGSHGPRHHAGGSYVVSGGSKGLGFATAGSSSTRAPASSWSPAIASSLDAAVCSLGVRRGRPARRPRGRRRPLPTAVELAESSVRPLDGGLVSVGGPPAGSPLTTTDEQWRRPSSRSSSASLRLARALCDGHQSAPGGRRPGRSLGAVDVGRRGVPRPDDQQRPAPRPGDAGHRPRGRGGPTGIRVNGLLPGRIATDRLAALDAATGDADAARARASAAIPLRRYGEPAEFGRVGRLRAEPGRLLPDRRPRPGRRRRHPASLTVRARRRPRPGTGCGTARRRRPPRASSSSWVPRSTTVPPSTTRIWSARRTVLSRCAMTTDVRPSSALSRARCTAASLSLSRCAVASSRTTTRGPLRSRRARAMRCFSPPESRWPRSPTTVSRPSGS